MSYILESKCQFCDRYNKCVDRYFLEGAISGIHLVNGYTNKSVDGKPVNSPINRGHLGAGIIRLECQSFIELEKSAALCPDQIL